MARRDGAARGIAAALQEVAAAARLLLPADHVEGCRHARWAAALSAALGSKVDSLPRSSCALQRLMIESHKHAGGPLCHSTCPRVAVAPATFRDDGEDQPLTGPAAQSQTKIPTPTSTVTSLNGVTLFSQGAERAKALAPTQPAPADVLAVHAAAAFAARHGDSAAVALQAQSMPSQELAGAQVHLLRV